MSAAAAAMSTSPNAGMPLGLRKRAHDAIASGKDMTPDDWRGLVSGLVKFFGEEAEEPEHAEDDDAPKTLYASRPLKNGADLVAWARKAGFKKTYPADQMHITVAYSKAPLEWPEPAADDVVAPDASDALNGTRSVEQLGDEGAIVLRFESPALKRRWHELCAAGAEWRYPTFKPHVTFTMDAGDVDLSKVEPYAGALEFGPEALKELNDGADWADKARAAMVGDEAPIIDGVEIDRDHDGPWMSCMSVDGHRMYRNKSLPETVDIDGKTVIVDEMLVRHEKAERDDLEELIQDFKKSNNREPDTEERKAIYLKAHKRSGTPAERAYAKKIGVDWERWSAWCRGEETRIEKGPFTNQPQDADVKPIPHGHGDLAATDSALRIALDRDSVREKDKDGRLRIETANISKACVNPYAGHEIPNYEELGLDPNKIYKLLRDPAELKKAATSFNGVQILKKHIPVSAQDGQKWDVVGTTGSEAKFGDPFLTNSLFIWTQDGIDLIESDIQKELSCGYHYKPDMTPGDFDGTSYDGVMRDIVGNHVALVRDGRAGPDVVVGDSTENLPMAKPTRFAATALQLAAVALAPILAKDHKLDILPLFKDLTSKNFKTQKPIILAGLKTATKGQLAMDADPNMGHVAQMLDSIEGLAAGSADESVSEEQHKAMEAAAHGESNLGIPKKVGKEFVSKDAGLENLKGYLKEKGVGDDVIGGACDMVSSMMPENAAEDAEETPEEKAAREAEEKKAKDAALETEAAAAKKDAEGEDADKVTKPAMDAAIKAAVDLTAKRVKSEVMANQKAIVTATQAVRPYVGELAMSFDSADEVYKTALTMKGVDIKGVDASAFPALLKMLPLAGARSAVDKLAQDSTATAGAMSFAERHPEVARIRTV